MRPVGVARFVVVPLDAATCMDLLTGPDALFRGRSPELDAEPDRTEAWGSSGPRGGVGFRAPLLVGISNP